MNTFFFLALIALPTDPASQSITPSYPCHFKQAHCAPPPPINIPPQAHQVCASEKEGTSYTWMLNPDRAIEGHCKRIEGKMRFVLVSKK